MNTKILRKTFVALVLVTGLQTAYAKADTAPVDAQIHHDIVDALIRFTNGMDTDNKTLIASAFTHDGIADFTPAAKKVGMQFPVLTGKKTIASALIPFAANYVTTHSVSNTRVQLDGDKAQLYALVEANHLPVNDESRFYMMKNQYWMTLKIEEGVWRISQMTINNLWSQGELSVMTGN